MAWSNVLQPEQENCTLQGNPKKWKYDTFPRLFSATITHNTIGWLLSNEKDKIPIINRADVVYKTSCECGICYIDQIDRSLKDRTYEHQKCSEMQIRSNKDEQNLEEKTPFALHAIKTGHTVAFGIAQPVITNVRNPYERQWTWHYDFLIEL